MRKTILLTSVLLVITGLSFSTVIPVPPTEEDIQGSWVGVPYEMNHFCRLVLTNGRGLFARSLQPESPMIYNVDSYKVDRQGGVVFNMSSASTNAYPIVVTGKATHNKIRIKISSPDNGWSHKSVVYREETVERMIRALKAAMNEMKGS